MKKLLIVSANFKKAYPIIKSLKGKGYFIIGGFYQLRSPVFSRYIDKRYRISNPYFSGKKYFIDILYIIKRDKPEMIIPVGYIDVVTITRYKDKMPENVIIPLPPYDDILKVSDKKRIKGIIKSLGIQTPREYTIKSLDEAEKLPLPIVIKKRFDASKPKYFFLRSALIDYLRKGFSPQNLIIEEYIPGIGHGYFAISNKGRIILDFAHIRKIEKKPSGGPSVSACSFLDPKLMRIGRKIVSKLKWTGMIMIEFRRHIETGEYIFLEINPKFWGSLELATSCGYDFPGVLVDLFLKKKSDSIAKLRVREKCCFTWILDGLHYLVNNYKIWWFMVKNIKNRDHFSDIHLKDPTEFFYSLSTRMYNIVFCKKMFYTVNVIDMLKRYIRYLLYNDIKYIIFDFDGTLVNLNIDWNEIKKELIKKGLISKYDYIMASIYQYKTIGSEKYRIISDIVERYERYAINTAKIEKELSKNLQILRNKYGLKLVIVSKQPASLINDFLQKNSLNNVFDIVIGREQSLIREEQIKIARQTLSLETGLGIVVGDSLNDMVAAAKLNLLPFAITKAPYKTQMFYEYGILPYADLNALIKDVLKILGRKHGYSFDTRY